MQFSIAQNNQSNFWTEVLESKTNGLEKHYRKTMPENSKFYTLNLDALRSVLSNVPDRKLNSNSEEGLLVQFPSSDGNLTQYRVMEASIMHPELQSKYSEIRSYVGVGVDNPSAYLRFSVSPYGLHAMVLGSGSGVEYVDPYTKTNDIYIVYNSKSLPALDSNFECGVEDEELEDFSSSTDGQRNADDGILRTFRLALASTIEYSSFHANQAGVGGSSEAVQKAAVLAAMNVTMTRVNGIYERDLSITMELVFNNDSIIYIFSDSFTNNNAGALINESQTVIDNVIGNIFYDIGHTFSTGGGGLAQLNSPCQTGSKARGITGLSAPVGDPYDVDYVAHEMGHQYGGPHTFNGSAGSCSGGNRSASNAYEPGSGTTIMAYAGICSPQNVQNNSDAYFHQNSLFRMWSNISNGVSTCGAQTPTGNSLPTAEAGENYNIPISTPYKLIGSSTDADGTTQHTYTWEQYDLGPAGIPGNTTVSGPLVRSIEGTTSPIRYIPRFEDVLSNGGESTQWEKLVSVARDINFKLTVRDNGINGGQVAVDEMMATTIATSGPFLVTSQNNNETLGAGAMAEITWDVANTTEAPINTSNVNILLSIDGGNSFPYVIGNNVENNGSYNAIIPVGTATSQARIIVESVGNIFYAINQSNFSIEDVDFSLTPNVNAIDVCQPDSGQFEFVYNTYNGFNGTTTFSATGNPAGSNVSFSPTSVSANNTAVTMTVSNTASATPGMYTILIEGTSGSSNGFAQVNIDLYSSTISAPILMQPSNGATNMATTLALGWASDVNAQSYEVQIAADASFNTIVETGMTTGTAYNANTLNTGTLYYWRVIASNPCGPDVISSVFNFTTANISCDDFTAGDTPITILASSIASYSSTVNVPTTGTVTDVNVTINIPHTYVEDLNITLTSPNGTEVDLSIANGGSGNNYTDTVFDQEAGTAITSGSVPFTGTFIPEGDLSTIYGEASEGDWVLTVVDTFAADGGTIEEFTLNLCIESALSIDEVSLSEFKVYPNPNTGLFWVEFNSQTSSDLKFEVYDIRGRQIFNETENANGYIRKDINLTGVSSGVYVLYVSDGTSKVSRKLVIE
ncbi:MAG: hypothetical protein BM564_06365 [Bacteroidetes bacterium MedPE-SWsnd-G2]|nr:MAG: hypothetical protein BM564_06365 [Bacteroidetes bacterium MedPE-SWsnd-G2]